MAVVVLMCMTSLSCCRDDDEPEQENWEVTAILTPNGLGDLGYNDQMYLGFCYIREKLGCDVVVKFPSSIDEAAKYSQEWMDAKQSSLKHRLLVLCEDDYADYVIRQGWSSTPDRAILQLGSKDESVPFYTRSLPLYGACYAVGKVCAETLEATSLEGTALEATKKHAALVMANDTDGSILAGQAGFMKATAEENLPVDTYYMKSSEDATGYNSADSLYHLCYHISPEVSFLLPLAGGSNSGVYRYGREHQNSKIWTVAMDSDMSYLSYTCSYGIMTMIDQLILDFCSNWKEGIDQPQHGICGLASGYISVKGNSYDKERTWGTGLEAILPEAIALENEYFKDYNVIVR